jgi:hypothetical protein
MILLRGEFMNELVKLYEEYVKLLEEECNDLFGLAYIHGYTSDPERVKLGEQYRKEISEIKNR